MQVLESAAPLLGGRTQALSPPTPPTTPRAVDNAYASPSPISPAGSHDHHPRQWAHSSRRQLHDTQALRHQSQPQRWALETRKPVIRSLRTGRCWLPVAAGIFLVILFCAESRAQTLTQGSTCAEAPYSGSACPSSIMNYQVAIPQTAQASVDKTLNITLSQLTIFKAADEPCYNALVALTCSIGFPKCGTAKVQQPCLNACSTAYSICTSIFTKFGLLQTLQDAVKNCTTISDEDPEKYPTTDCYTPPAITAAAAAAGNGTSSGNAPRLTTCPAFFIPSTQSDFSSLFNCDSTTGCCIPCPIQNYLYPQDQFNEALNVGLILNVVSTVLMGLVVMSWCILPGRRTHPGDIVLHFSMAVFLWQAANLFLVGNPKRVLCKDDVTVATSSNNVLCRIQAALLMYMVHAAVFWAGYMILNLHTTIVWRSVVLQRYKPAGIIVCWGVPVALTALPFVLSTVDASSGLACIITDKVNGLFFLPDGIIAVPAFFINTATMLYILYMVRKHVASKSGSTGSSNQTSVHSHPVSNSTTKPISVRRQILILLRMNWRAMLLGLVFILTYLVYFIYTDSLSRQTANTDWVTDWTACIVSNATATNLGAVQDYCARTIAAPHLPSFNLLIYSNVITSAFGVWTFLIFGVNMQIIKDWIAVCTRRPKAPPATLLQRDVSVSSTAIQQQEQHYSPARWAPYGTGSQQQYPPHSPFATSAGSTYMDTQSSSTAPSTASGASTAAFMNSYGNSANRSPPFSSNAVASSDYRLHGFSQQQQPQQQNFSQQPPVHTLYSQSYGGGSGNGGTVPLSSTQLTNQHQMVMNQPQNVGYQQSQSVSFSAGGGMGQGYADQQPQSQYDGYGNSAYQRNYQ
ncbi:hypothetical protein DFJ73DRAFT_840615 [Zopfochytrium polystomum]|nr:hypothetical protein DFJ73DRAFT_840615 [Zopfochytrium polystomum]